VTTFFELVIYSFQKKKFNIKCFFFLKSSYWWRSILLFNILIARSGVKTSMWNSANTDFASLFPLNESRIKTALGSFRLRRRQTSFSSSKDCGRGPTVRYGSKSAQRPLSKSIWTWQHPSVLKLFSRIKSVMKKELRRSQICKKILFAKISLNS